MREFKKERVLELLGDRIERALSYLDDFAMSGASAKDLAIISGILIEKHQLLNDRPTGIMSHEG